MTTLVIKIQLSPKEERLTCIKPKRTTFKDFNNHTRTYLDHECELSAAVTIHEMQGKTVASAVLSLNSITGISRRIHAILMSSMYVGCSRVHSHEQLRVLPLSQADKDYLKKLKWDPYLRKFFQNYDSNGCWKSNGLKQQRKDFVRTTRLNLGFLDLEDLTVQELKKFARDLDVIVTKPNKAEYFERLQSEHEEGRKLLDADDKRLRKKVTMSNLHELQKKNVRSMRHQELKRYAKRIGIKDSIKTSKTELIKKIENEMNNNGIACLTKTAHRSRIKEKDALRHVEEVDEFIIPSSSEAAMIMDVDQTDETIVPISSVTAMKEKMLTDDDCDDCEDEDEDIDLPMNHLDLSLKHQG